MNTRLMDIFFLLQHEEHYLRSKADTTYNTTYNTLLVLLTVYYTDGQFVRSFGERILTVAWDITVANDGRVMLVGRYDSCVHYSVNTATVLTSFNFKDVITSLELHSPGK